jgi:predicted ATPase/transcriptional regulator with XRE-family HTH domain
MNDPVSFGRRLKLRRQLLDITRDELAVRVGCAVETIRKIEVDVRRPSRQIAERLADQLAIPPQERAAFLQHARAQPRARGASDTQALTRSLRRAADGRPISLPAPLTSLLGREQDVAAVCNYLLRPNVRLLTLVGPPGVGKTRLGLQAAERLHERFADGAYFVDLAAASELPLVAAAIAQALGVSAAAGQALFERLADFLNSRQLLLLLDTFEQALDAAPLVTALLVAAPQLKVLITSRAALRVSGEHEFPVAPLALPSPGQALSAQEMACYPAVELLVQRMQALHPGFMLTDTNACAAAEICARLDGLPLAIELAARSRLLAPQALLARLIHRLALLTNGARDVSQRQRSMRDAIAWSYELLDAGQQLVFAQLGVFAGGCTLEAAERVLSAEERVLSSASTVQYSALSTQHSVHDALTALVDQSLLRQEECDDGELRFVMLETIREYALERLVASGCEAAARELHAAYYLRLAETSRAAGAEEWLRLVACERANLEAALCWLGGRGAEAAWLVGCLEQAHAPQAALARAVGG